jgi:hypothetical protein
MAQILAQVCDGGYGKNVMKGRGRNRGFFTDDPPQPPLTGFQGHFLSNVVLGIRETLS